MGRKGKLLFQVKTRDVVKEITFPTENISFFMTEELCVCVWERYSPRETELTVVTGAEGVAPLYTVTLVLTQHTLDLYLVTIGYVLQDPSIHTQSAKINKNGSTHTIESKKKKKVNQTFSY